MTHIKFFFLLLLFFKFKSLLKMLPCPEEVEKAR